VGRSEKDIDALYGQPLEEFTKARNELASELRSKGDGGTADRVRALAKPTTAAWAVNQVMRTQTKDARALLDAGERLREVHEGVTAGTADARDLRDAVQAEREVVGRLTDAARGLMNVRGGDLSESVLERVAQTLHALAADSEVRSMEDATRLSAERRPMSAGAFAAPSGKGRSRKSPARGGGAVKGRKPRGGDAAKVRKARERLQQAKYEARDLRSSRTRAARATADAERALVRAREEMRKADQKVADKEAEIEELRRLEEMG
jgi:hypothetical protein